MANGKSQYGYHTFWHTLTRVPPWSFLLHFGCTLAQCLPSVIIDNLDTEVIEWDNSESAIRQRVNNQRLKYINNVPL
jgi:hypothetical protein